MSSQQPDEEAIFHIARKLENVGDRDRYLDQVCAGDQQLRERVEALLEAHEKESELLKSSPKAQRTVDHMPITETTGQRIGRFKLLQKIGEGGFGVVYMAEQVRPVRRKVALKIIKPGMDTHAVVARFEAERQALALMDHPNISRVLDGGATESGRPYFVMELVRGVPVTEYCDKNNLPTRERLELFITICQAVQHAHQKGIIHRDLKPSNILITLADGKPVVKVIDFGVSKALNQQLTEKTLFTAYGQMIGTPQYMSPEQAEMSCLDVDTRSDIYSLGVLLYELLTGATPVEGERLRSAGYAEMQRIIQEEEPPKPSVRLSSAGEKLTVIAKHRSVTPDQLHKQVRGDLDWIVMKSLEKDRKRRFESAGGLSRDVERFLHNDPITARPPSRLYRIRKFIGRNKVATAFSLTVFMTIVVGLIGTSTGWKAAREGMQKAREAEGRAVSNADEANSERTRAEALANSLTKRLYAADMNNAMTAWERNDPLQMANLLDKYESSDLRHWEWYHLKNLLQTAEDPVLLIPPREPLRLALSPIDNKIVSTHSGGAVITVDDLTNDAPKSFGEVEDGIFSFTYASFSPDGTSFLHPDNAFSRLVIRDAETLEINQQLDENDLGVSAPYISTATFSPNGRQVVMAVKKRGIFTYDLQTGKSDHLIEIPNLNKFESIEFSADGTLLAVSSEPIIVVSFPGGEVLHEFSGHTKQITSVRFASDDKWLITASRDRSIIVWDTETGARIRQIGPLDAEVRQLAVHADTHRLAAGLRNRTLKIWNLPEFDELDEVRGYNGLYALDFDRRGRLVYGSFGGSIKIRDTNALTTRNRINCGGYVTDLAFSSCGKYVTCLTNHVDESNPEQGEQVVRLFDIGFHDDRGTDIPGIVSNTSAIATTTNGNHNLLAVGARDSARLQIIDLESREIVHEIELIADGEISAIAFRPDGHSVVCGLRDGRLVDVQCDNKVTYEFFAEQHRSSITEIAFLSDGRCVSGASDGSLYVWNEGRKSFPHQVPKTWIRGLDTDGQSLAFGLFGGRNDDMHNVFLGESNGELKGLYAHAFSIQGLAFIEHGETLVTLGGDREMKLWSRATLEQRLAIHESEIFNALAVSPDEQIIAAGTREGSIFLYRTGRE